MTTRDDGVRLAHLQGRAAAIRQVLAADAVRSIPHVVEIGGAGLPITDFLRPGPLSVTVIDPKIGAFEAEMLAGLPCRVRHVPLKVQAAAEHLPGQDHALVMLGLSLKPWGDEPAVPSLLIHLCRTADIVVIEHAVQLDRARDQAPQLIGDGDLDRIWSMDYRLADGMIEATGHDQRRFTVLKPRRPRPH